MKPPIALMSLSGCAHDLTDRAVAPIIALALLASSLSADLAVVADGAGCIPIVVASNAPPANSEAARDLANYIHKICGAQPEVIVGNPDPLPDHAIWVGLHPRLADVPGRTSEADLGVRRLDAAFPAEPKRRQAAALQNTLIGTKPVFTHPEEILIACNGRHLVVAGRDRISEGEQVEYGTANAVYTFLQKHLGVRWLWPGELGEDIIPRKNISLAPFAYRFHPRIRERRFRNPQSPAVTADLKKINRWWKIHQRGRGSFRRPAGQYVSTGWWEKYGETHPEYFGLQPDGKRRPVRGEVKLCVSNPEVAELWIVQTTRMLENHPEHDAIWVAPSDGGGWCMCPRCRAWDHPDAGTLSRDRKVLTDRYVRFWNRLSRGLVERLPDRDVALSSFAYTRYRSPPIEAIPATNIIMGFVGIFPLNSNTDRRKEKEAFRAWAQMASRIRYRPNLFWTSGGFWGWPSIDLEHTIEDFCFIAENHCVGLDVDSVFNCFATQGPQLYLMAQLAYDPLQDGRALLDDYFARGFGPAADDVRRYVAMLEEAHRRVVNKEGWVASLRQAGGFVLEAFKEIYTDEWIEAARDVLERAHRRAAAGPEKYRRRVAFVRTGLRYTALSLDIIRTMDDARTSGGTDREAVHRAIALCAEREELMRTSEPCALDHLRIPFQIKRRGLRDRLGPPSDELVAVATNVAADKLAPAEWTPAFRDDFERETLGPHWKVVRGAATIKDGALVSTRRDTILMLADEYPGLQRLEFEVAALPPEGTDAEDPTGASRVSDLSSLVHADSEGTFNSGYLLQFGGNYNSRNRLLRLGKTRSENRDRRIQPGRKVVMVAEFDGRHVRLTVDDDVVLEYAEPVPLLGPGHRCLGLYFFTPASVSSVRVYTSEAQPAASIQEGADYL